METATAMLPHVRLADIPVISKSELERLLKNYEHELDPAARYDRWEPRDWKTILTNPTPPTLYVIEGLLGQQSGAFIAGKPHAMKSLSTLYGSLEVLTKGTFWGLKAHGVERVVFLETEDPRIVVEQRIRELSKGLDVDPENVPDGFVLLTPGRIDLGNAQTQATLYRKLREHKPDIAVFSTLQGMLGEQDWNQQSDMSPIHAFVMLICREICPVILITHAPQDKKQRRPIGSISQSANYLVVGHVSKWITPKGEQQISLELDSKLGGQKEFTLRLVTDGQEIRGFEQGKSEHGRKEDILELHELEPELKPQEIADRLAVSVQYVRRVLAESKLRKKH